MQIMKKTSLITLAGFAALSAAPALGLDHWNYVWTGEGIDNGYETEGNETHDRTNWGYVYNETQEELEYGIYQTPESNAKNWAYIGYTFEGYNTYVPTTSGEHIDVTASLGTVQSGSVFLNNATLAFKGQGSYNFTDVHIGANSAVSIETTGEVSGFANGAKMDISGAVTATDAPLFTMNVGKFKSDGNDALALTGTLDLAALSHSRGSVVLVDISADEWVGGLSVDYSGLTFVNNNSLASLDWVGTEQGNGQLVLSYVPEPATATLSLLALAGLAARRRRK